MGSGQWAGKSERWAVAWDQMRGTWVRYHSVLPRSGNNNATCLALRRRAVGMPPLSALLAALCSPPMVVSRARQANLALEPMHLFRHPSIAELARAADAIGEPDDSSQLSTRTVAPFELIPGAIDRKVLERAFT